MFLSVHILSMCVGGIQRLFLKPRIKVIASPRKCRQYFAKTVARKVKDKKFVSAWRSLTLVRSP